MPRFGFVIVERMLAALCFLGKLISRMKYTKKSNRQATSTRSPKPLIRQRCANATGKTLRCSVLGVRYPQRCTIAEPRIQHDGGHSCCLSLEMREYETDAYNGYIVGNAIAVNALRQHNLK